MPDSIKVKETKDGKYIEVISEEEVTGKEVQGSILKMKEIFEATGIDRVFVDASKLPKMPGTFGAFEIGERIALQTAALRFAILVNKNIEKEAVFLENVAINRGGQVRTFREWQAAYDWLMK